MGYRSFTFIHPTLGSLSGLVVPGDKVVQFRSVPYAKISERFAHSVLLESLDGTDREFVKPGYIRSLCVLFECDRPLTAYSFACPHTYGMSDAHSGGRYPEEPDIQMDEHASLILTVSVPLEFLIRHTAGEEFFKLPVMTYIHGGACKFGLFPFFYHATQEQF